MERNPINQNTGKTWMIPRIEKTITPNSEPEISQLYPDNEEDSILNSCNLSATIWPRGMKEIQLKKNPMMIGSLIPLKTNVSIGKS